MKQRYFSLILLPICLIAVGTVFAMPTHNHIVPTTKISDLSPLQARTADDILNQNRLNKLLPRLHDFKQRPLIQPGEPLPQLRHQAIPMHGGPSQRLRDIHQTPIATPAMDPRSVIGGPNAVRKHPSFVGEP